MFNSMMLYENAIHHREKHRLPLYALYSVNFLALTHFQTRIFFLCQVRSGGPAICDKTGRYVCQQFACTFVSMEGLKRHVRHVHQKLVKFRCQICDKGYHDRRNYHDHMATHAGVKRNVCTICQTQFTFKRGLKAHVMSFHPDAIESLSHS